MHEVNPVKGWREALEDLEQVLLQGEPVEKLAQVAAPEFLGLLFRLQLDVLVRRGPVADGLEPRVLLQRAQEAAKVGALPLGIATALRLHLPKLEALVKKCGAWERSQPLWWQPLAEPLGPETPAAPEGLRLEDLWQRLDDGTLVEVPTRGRLGSALTTGDHRWLAMPQLLMPGLLQPLWQELEEAHELGRLDLERGGVGGGAVSSRRSDEVLYFSGLEPELLRTAPHLGALIQWSLDRWGRRLAGLGGHPVFPPARAMLARYPAPSAGYAAHLDNPGGQSDNGRALTLVIYLNGPGEECRGGEISLWAEGARTTAPPAVVLPPKSGAAVIFDARAVAHRVEPVASGRPRWALTLWFNDTPQRPPSYPLPSAPTLSDILRPLLAPPLPNDTVLFHQLDEQSAGGELTVWRRSAPCPRSAVVATVYGAGADLGLWCRHHFDHGLDHAVLVFDHLEEPEEAATAADLRQSFPPDRLTIWSGQEMAQGWSTLPQDPRLAPVRRLAEYGGASSYAVASRQALNASVVLQAARRNEVGTHALDWLLHLDADELLLPLGPGRGGGDLAEHFAAASAAGLKLVRYVNHELLPPSQADKPPRFKVNPRLAAAGLGLGGWQALVHHLGLGQSDPRPWFHGYFNGKSAVAVAAGSIAAGVHSWFLAEPDVAASRLLAGPVVLHFHFRTAASFRRKYLAAFHAGTPPGPLPFAPCPAEEAALHLVRSLIEQGVSNAELEGQLDQLHRTLTTFSERDLELLQEAGLIFEPRLTHWPTVAGHSGKTS